MPGQNKKAVKKTAPVKKKGASKKKVGANKAASAAKKAIRKKIICLQGWTGSNLSTSSSAEPTVLEMLC